MGTDRADNRSSDAANLRHLHDCLVCRILHFCPRRERHAGRIVTGSGRHRCAHRRRRQNSEAIRLLAEGRGERLLISGVNKSTRAPQIISLNTAGQELAFLFRCCVDLDKRSLNTEDNAVQATVWARKRGFRSLLVVTSTYHMPRAIIELRQSMPEVELVPYPVKSPRMETEWWNDSRTSWVLCKEYLKFVTASARYAANLLANGSGKTEPNRRTINARMD